MCLPTLLLWVEIDLGDVNTQPRDGCNIIEYPILIGRRFLARV